MLLGRNIILASQTRSSKVYEPLGVYRKRPGIIMSCLLQLLRSKSVDQITKELKSHGYHSEVRE